MNLARFSPVFALVTLLFSIVFESPQLHAGASNKNGNPYGNGTFFPDSGSYTALMRGPNGFVGTVQFATSDTNTSTNSSTNSGVATVYAGGQQYIGSAYGAQNVSSQELAVTYYGNASSQVIALPTVYYTLQDYTDQYGYTYSLEVPTFGVTNFTASNSCSGAFTATLQNSYPNQTFTGSGQCYAEIQGVSSIIVTNSVITAGSSNVVATGTTTTTNGAVTTLYTTNVTPAVTNSSTSYQYLFTNSTNTYDTSVTGSRVVDDSSSGNGN
jgi:hypothetical protein